MKPHTIPGIRHQKVNDVFVIGFDARFVNRNNPMALRLAPATALLRLLQGREGRYPEQERLWKSDGLPPLSDVERVSTAIQNMAIAMSDIMYAPSAGRLLDYALDVKCVLECMAGRGIGEWFEATELAASDLGVREIRVVGEGVVESCEVTEIRTPHFRAVYQLSA